jgi:hypothetical protein
VRLNQGFGSSPSQFEAGAFGVGDELQSLQRRIQQSTGEILKFEANLAKVLLGFVILEGSDDFLKRKTAVDNGLQTIGRYRPDHVLLICSAANGDPADTNLIRKQ